VFNNCSNADGVGQDLYFPGIYLLRSYV